MSVALDCSAAVDPDRVGEGETEPLALAFAAVAGGALLAGHFNAVELARFDVQGEVGLDSVEPLALPCPY